jgi:hypothetical protein
MILGGNLLTLAMGLVGPSGPIALRRFTGQEENAAGYQVPTYAAPAAIEGRVQPVPQRLYQALGLDLTKDYVTLYTPANVVAVDRDGAGDRITYNGRTYSCESATDWQAQDGWSSVLCVRVKTP